MYKNKAFLSYCHSPRDAEVARLLQQSLEHFRIPKEIAQEKGISRIGRIFRDQTDLGAHFDLSEELKDEIDNSEFLIVLCSPETSRSRWVGQEISHFLENHPSSAIIPVLTEGEPAEVLSDVFGQIKGMPRELYACDCRGSARRILRHEIPRIASSLLGCDYDELVKRHRRYQRRRRGILLAALALLTAAALLYHFLSQARYRKSLQEKAAEEARNLALLSEQALAENRQFDAIRLALEAVETGENGLAQNLPWEDFWEGFLQAFGKGSSSKSSQGSSCNSSKGSSSNSAKSSAINPAKNSAAPGEAVLALQKAVGAYLPESRSHFSQTGEFPVNGEIDDWACLEAGGQARLAVQYYDYALASYQLALWNAENFRKLFDSSQEPVFEAAKSREGSAEGLADGEDESREGSAEGLADGEDESREGSAEGLADGEGGSREGLSQEMEDEADMTADAGASLLAASGMVIWSKGEWIAGIDAATGQILWRTRTPGTDTQVLLSGNDEFFLVHVTDSRTDLPSDILQLRRKKDGSLLPGGTVSLPGIRQVQKGEAYTEIPRAAIPPSGNCFLVEEDVHSYFDEAEDRCRLYLISMDTLTPVLFSEEKGILDMTVDGDGDSLVLAAAVSSDAEDLETEDSIPGLVLKSLRLSDRRTEWTTDTSLRTDDFVRILQNGDLLLVSGTQAGSYDKSDGRELSTEHFSDPAASAFLRENKGRKTLMMVTQAGSLVEWDYRQNRSRLSQSVFPNPLLQASLADGCYFLNYSRKDEAASRDTIAVFAPDVWDRSLQKLTVTREQNTPAGQLSFLYASGRTFVLMDMQDRIFLLDAYDGSFLSAAPAGKSFSLTGISEEDGLIAFHADPDSTNGQNGGSDDTWLLLDLKTGKSTLIQDPAAGLTPGKDMEYISEALSGRHLEFAVLVRDSEKESLSAAGQKASPAGEHERKTPSASGQKAFLVRYLPEGKKLDSIDITDLIPNDAEIDALYGNASGTNTLCFLSREKGSPQDSLVWADWAAGTAAVRELPEGLSLIPSPRSPWSPDGKEVLFQDYDCRLHIFSRDGSEKTLPESGSLLAGYDFLEGRLITVEAQENSLFCKDENGLSLVLPVSSEAVLDLPALSQYPGETPVNTFRLGDGKMLLQYGDEAFVIDLTRKDVEMSVTDFMGYNPDTDMLMIGDEDAVYIRKRYTAEDLLKKGREILRNTGSSGL